MAIDLYQDVTDRIIAALEAGTAPWVKPWQTGDGSSMPHNATTGRAYNGVNVLLLWATQIQGGFTSNAWLTFKQAKQLGGSVRKGEHGTRIVFWKFLKRTEKDSNGEAKDKTIPMARAYTVFNAEQCDDLKLPKRETAGITLTDHERHELAEHVITSSGAVVTYDGDRACFMPSAAHSSRWSVVICPVAECGAAFEGGDSMITMRLRTLAAVLLVVAVASYWRGGYVRGLQEEVWTAQDQLELDILNECLEEEQEASI